MIDRRRFLKLLGALPLIGSATARAFAIDAPSSVVPRRLLIIIIDDVGIDQLSFYGLGGPYPPTPRLAQLATERQLWTRAWGFPTCSPTRAAIQTGRWPFRCGIGYQLQPGMPSLQLSEVCLPQAIAPVPCGMFGKWHLGLGDDAGGFDAPRAHGYQRGVVTGGNLLDDPDSYPDSYTEWTWYRDGLAESATGYAPSATVDEALSWIGEQGANWLAVVAFHLAHDPWHCPPPPLGGQCSVSWSNNQRFDAMVTALDTELGRLVDGLPEETTLIIVGDNGSDRSISIPPVPPGRAKGTVYQGGLRVPLICWGPGVTSAVVDSPASVVDIYSTACDLFNVAHPPEAVDSVSFAPSFETPTLLRQRILYGELWDSVDGSPFARAAMDGPYKLIRWTDESEQVFEISTDPWEQADLLPDLTSRQQVAYEVLSAFLDALEDDHLAPPDV